jgi:hypothetical protein
MARPIWIAVALVCAAPELNAQSVQNLNGWYNYFGEYGIGGKWTWWSELQARRNEGLPEPQQYLIRTAAYRRINQFAKVGTGYGFIRTFPYGNARSAAVVDENRIFHDLIADHTRDSWRFNHRFRWEERWIGPTHRFQLRFRYRFAVRRPIAASKAWYWTMSDEIILNVPPNLSSKFDQNRAIAALGRNVKGGWRVEAGFLEQTLRLRNGILENNHTVLFQVFAPPWKLRK